MLQAMGMWVATLLLGQFSMMGGDPRREFAAGDKEAVMMFPPETVCGASASEMVWTADSSALVVTRGSADIAAADVIRFMGGSQPTEADVARLKPMMELVVWNVKSRKARTIVSGDATRLMVSEIQPMPGGDRMVLSLRETGTGPKGEPMVTNSIALLSPSAGTLTRLSAVREGGAMESFQVSSSKGLGFVRRIDLSQGVDTVRFFGADGRLGNPLRLPPRSNVTFEEGGIPSITIVERKEGAKPKVRITRIDPSVPRLLNTIDYSPSRDLQTLPNNEAQKPLGLQLVVGEVAGASAPSIFLKVSGGKPEELGVVTTDGTRGLLSPKGDAIAYVSQGSAMVRLIAKVPRSAYDQARMAAERSAALSNAKQAALALIMYAADMDDTLPNGDIDLRARVGPYMRNSSILSSFTYTFGGGDMKSIQNPAGTEIGYVTGPGGRAVAYADGHVRWIPDTP